MKIKYFEYLAVNSFGSEIWRQSLIFMTTNKDIKFVSSASASTKGHLRAYIVKVLKPTMTSTPCK